MSGWQPSACVRLMRSQMAMNTVAMSTAPTTTQETMMATVSLEPLVPGPPGGRGATITGLAVVDFNKQTLRVGK
jgi:hypothetical protein